MKLTQHFTLEEMTHSDYAIAHNINNTANEVVQENLIMLCTLILEPLRSAIGEPLIINSGFRNAAVNAGVGGVKSSHHLLGLAADINYKNEAQLKLMIANLKENTHIDLALVERSRSSSWLHVQLPLKNTQPRRRISTVYVRN